MKAVIDTSSLLSLVRYYLPFDKKGVLFDLKLFKKITAICTILGIPVLTLPELLEKYTEVDLGFE